MRTMGERLGPGIDNVQSREKAESFDMFLSLASRLDPTQIIVTPEAKKVSTVKRAIMFELPDLRYLSRYTAEHVVPGTQTRRVDYEDVYRELRLGRPDWHYAYGTYTPFSLSELRAIERGFIDTVIERVELLRELFPGIKMQLDKSRVNNNANSRRLK